MKIDISPPNQALKLALQHKIDTKTKPLGALGLLESLAQQLGLIQNTLTPKLNRPALLVFAGDHGVAAAGVSSYPQAVTAQMVLNFLRGGAAINVFARQHGFAMRVVDAGVNHMFDGCAGLVNAKVGMGTQNFMLEPAMTLVQCEQALNAGVELAAQEIEAGSNVLAFGEMGIGNTSAASCLMSVLCEIPIVECVGRGTGVDDAGLLKKVAVLTQALKRHASLNSQDTLAVLATFGGFEIAMMAGAMLATAQQKVVLLIDGFIATVALLVAARLQPEILHYCVFAHCADEAGHRRLLDELQAKPLLDAGLRLGEGTGAVLVYPLLQSAVNFLNEMASFESAGVSTRESTGASC
jgi:nicotinate-nucleotide--dimethylbenzimidazole phosphoribosyltransferase